MDTELDHRHRDGRIAQLARAQHGLVRLEQLRALGLTAAAVRKRVERGRLLTVRRGVYAVGLAPLGAEARWLAAAWSCGPEAVVSHRTGAAAWGIRRTTSAVIDVTVPSRAGKLNGAGIRLHRVARLVEVTEREGIPVTEWARTVLDLAAVLPPRDVELALERSEQLRLFDLTALERTLHDNSGRPGCAVLRSVLREARIGETATKNDLEEAMLILCRRYGLPRPQVNVPVGPYEADFLWRKQLLIAETDGWETHGTRAAFEDDRARDAALMAMGFRVVRFTYRQVLRRPREVAATLARLLTSTT
jgi:very-short-patch-repair endonuclease